MKQRQHRPTSKQGEEYIRPFKPSHKQKIAEGLEKLRVGGTYEEISMATGLREDQVWKRMSNLVEDKKVFDTGITRTLKSGLQGIVWQLKNLPIVNHENPKTDKEVQLLKKVNITVRFPVANQQNLFP